MVLVLILYWRSYKVQVGIQNEDNAEAMADVRKAIKLTLLKMVVKEEPVKKNEVKKEPASAAKYNVGDKVSFNYLHNCFRHW